MTGTEQFPYKQLPESADLSRQYDVESDARDSFKSKMLQMTASRNTSAAPVHYGARGCRPQRDGTR